MPEHIKQGKMVKKLHCKAFHTSLLLFRKKNGSTLKLRMVIDILAINTNVVFVK